MRKSKKNKRKFFGPVTVMMILLVSLIIISAICSILGLQANKTLIVNGSLETSLITVKNMLTIDGIKYIFTNAILNFQLLQPLALLIVSIMAFGVAEASGLLKIMFNPIKKLKGSVLTFIIVLLGFASTFIGEYSYIILFPLVGIIYKYANKNSMLGIVTVFLGITLGYGTGFIFNYDQHLLGTITQMSATIDVDKSYAFHNFSTLYIMIVSTIIMSIILSKLTEAKIAPKFKKQVSDQDEIVESKKALYFSNMALVFMMLCVVYMLIPGLYGSGMLLGNNSSNYIERLFGEGSPFRESFAVIILSIMMICSFIYGKISGNIKNSSDYSVSLSSGFEKCGFIFVLLFFACQMNNILQWTNLGEVIACKLVETLSLFQFSGILLIIIFFIMIIIMTIFMPSLLTKWSLTAPLVIPLFMRANITPDFTQFLFQTADSVGKCITPFFIYFIVMLGFMQKYNNDEETKISIFGVLKLILPTVIITAIFWLILLLITYASGLPLGISGATTL